MKVRGRLEPFYETGTEGVVWSLQDPWLPGYDGLWCLRDGDHLKVIDGGWEGKISLDYQRNQMSNEHGYSGQAVYGFWVNGLQEDAEAERWAHMFVNRARAILTPGDPQIVLNHDSEYGGQHPFHAPLEELDERLHALPEKIAADLFRASLYPWLVFYSGESDWHSLAQKWGYTLDETLKIIGSPTDEQVNAWRHYPKRATDMLMPFSWPQLLRLALLFRINGELEWQFASAAEAQTWLGDHRELMMGDLNDLRRLIGLAVNANNN
jgi:hypothetical protein